MLVVVAGGAGFIGSHLCDALVARGDEVIAVDNLLTGRLQNVAHLNGHERFSLIEHDITIPIVGADWLDGPVDAVLDLASPASPDDFATLPLEILAVGSTGTRNLLDLAMVPNIQQTCHLPIIVDPSHATGRPELIPAMARAAVAGGADGVHIEVHSCPEKAMSDGSQALLPDQYAGVMDELKQLATLFDKVIPVPQEEGE